MIEKLKIGPMPQMWFKFVPQGLGGTRRPHKAQRNENTVLRRAKRMANKSGTLQGLFAQDICKVPIRSG